MSWAAGCEASGGQGVTPSSVQMEGGFAVLSIMRRCAAIAGCAAASHSQIGDSTASMIQRMIPAPGSLRRPTAFGLSDVAVILGALLLLALIARVGAGAFVAFVPPRNVPAVSLDPRDLPYYAARSTLRMFIALGASFVFTLAYGYAAARSRYAERVLIPLLDILQSVPVLGFLSITVTGFIALFPGSRSTNRCARCPPIFPRPPRRTASRSGSASFGSKFPPE
jgi:hypothetical protein